MAWGWVKCQQILIFLWTIPLKVTKLCFLIHVTQKHVSKLEENFLKSKFSVKKKTNFKLNTVIKCYYIDFTKGFGQKYSINNKRIFYSDNNVKKSLKIIFSAV